MQRRKELKKELTSVFNKYVRLTATGWNGISICYTCEQAVSYIEAGHFVGSKANSLTWDERNVKPQCRKCNSKENGMRKVFAKKIDEEYGVGTSDMLKRLGNSTKKFTEFELEEMIEKYRLKLENIN